MGRRRALKRLKHESAYLLIGAVVRLFRLLPRKAALTLGSNLGRIAPCLFRTEYRLAVDHLANAFVKEKSRSEIRRLARESFRCAALNFVDAARIAVMSPEEIMAVCVPHGIDRALEVMGKGTGVVMISSHTGCWEMLGSYLILSGIPLAVVARRLYDQRLEDLLYRSRVGAGMRVILRGQDTRDVLRALREGYLLAALIDQDTRVKGVFVDFFGKPAHTASGPAALALRYGHPVLPVFTYRDKHNRHHICVYDCISIEETGDRDRDIEVLTAKCSQAIEGFVREHPEQWVWFHRRWKTRPEPPPEGVNP
jgi:KDO2-lipid IV(A) lauroyltransferase